MAVVARLVGMERRSYQGQDGKQREFCGLHLMHVEGSSKDVMGCKVETASCPRDQNPNSLHVGQLYEMDYEIYDSKNGKAARLVAMYEVEEDVPSAKEQVK